MEIGNNNSLTMGFKINSKKANMIEALIMVKILSGPKFKLPQISWCKTSAKARYKAYLKNFFILFLS
jgi:hypothetical protein